MASSTVPTAEDKMRKAIEGLQKDLASVRTGRASPALLDHVRVDYAGVPTPLNHIASVSIPEANLIIVQPWDKGTLKAIEKAIQVAEVGLTPVSDGTVIRLSVPPLSEERRQELIKVVRKRVEERKVVIRNLRRDAIEELKKAEKAKEISQDDDKRLQTQLQKITDKHIGDADQAGAAKEQELLKV